jgi:hypothetical protein
MINILSKDTLRSQIEKMSNGLNTIIYDAKGYPNAMYVLEPPNGGHPAFETASGNVNRIFISKYATSNTNDIHDTPIGISGAKPAFYNFDDDIFKQDSTNLNYIRSTLEDVKGVGWHYTNILEWNAYLKSTLETNPYRTEIFDIQHIEMSNQNIISGGENNLFIISSNEFSTPETLTPSTIYRLYPNGTTQPIKLTYLATLNDSTSTGNAESFVKATYVFEFSELDINRLKKYTNDLGEDAYKNLYVDGESSPGLTFSGTITRKNTGFVGLKTGSKNGMVDGIFGLTDIYYEQFYPGYGEWLDGAYLYKDNGDANPHVLKIGSLLYNYKTVSDISMGHTSTYNENIRVGADEDNIWKLGLVNSFDGTSYNRIAPGDWKLLDWIDTPSDNNIYQKLSAIFNINITQNTTMMDKINDVVELDNIVYNKNHTIINDYDVEGPPVGFYHYPIRINRFNYYWIKGKDSDGLYGGVGYNTPSNRFLGFTTRLTYIE